MDQIKTGKFISAMRKEKKMTQRQLADKLCISDKTISKWECGKGMPEVSLMMPLCEILEISVNELLSGERLEAQSYQKKAEENMMRLIEEKEESKKKIIMSVVVILSTFLPAFVLVVIASGNTAMSTALRIVLLAVAFAAIAGGISVACVLDRDVGVYECRKCGARFVPDMKSYVAGAHTLTTRRLKCPECGQKSYCKHRLTK